MVWPEPSASAARDLAREAAGAYATYVAGVSEEILGQPLAYRNQAGQAFVSTPAEILTHMLMHAASHRGDVLAAVGRAGGAAPDVDYIAWVRAGEPGVG